MQNIRQHQGETLMNWEDRAYQTCVRENPFAPEADLDRLASWIFSEGLLDGEITKEWRRQTYVGLAVTVGKALDLRLNIPATKDDNDDRWSTTATVGVRATRGMATPTEMEEVHMNPEFHFHFLDLLFFWTAKDAVGNQAPDQGIGGDNRWPAVPVKSSGNLQPIWPGRTLQPSLCEINEFCRDLGVRNSRKLTELLYATNDDNETKDSLKL